MMSLWENRWLFDADTIIIGSGIVGLSCAASILEEQPSHRVIILERGLVPSGASVKNAGIFTLGTYFEILQEIKETGEKAAFDNIKLLHGSLTKFRKRIGEENLDFKHTGGYDLVTEDMLPGLEKLKYVNDLLRPIFNEDMFYIANDKIEEFGFNKDIVKALVMSKIDGQFDSGKGILRFQNYVAKLGARIITGADVTGWKRDSEKNIVITLKNPAVEGGFHEFRSQNLVLCTESFSGRLVKGFDIYPFRGQVMVTSPIPDLKMKGYFLYHDNYFYIRNYYGRVLIGGGAINSWDEESVNEYKNTDKITNAIEKVLREVLLPNKEFKIDYKWAGIMLMGKKSSEPIVEEVEENVWTAFRMGGDGISRCSLAAEELKNKLLAKHKPKPRL